MESSGQQTINLLVTEHKLILENKKKLGFEQWPVSNYITGGSS